MLTLCKSGNFVLRSCVWNDAIWLLMMQVTLSMWRYLLTSDVGVSWRRVWRMLVVVAVLVVASGVVWIADASYDRACSTDQIYGRRAGVCGPRLVELLRVVCRGVYNKRSADCENHSLTRFCLS